MKQRIVVGLSGGVDSSVTALLLKQQGFDVHAVFMRNWQEDDEHCPATQDFNDARAVAAKLDIPLTQVSFAEDYWQRVFQYFLDEYAAGRTPNPDILCNQEIKFKAFLDYALNELGADKIATGHYARIGHHANNYQLLTGLDANKDQSYFLYRLNQQQLSRALFPIGELQKTAVRELAKQHDLITHNKKDSTGICFIGERRFNEFLNEYLLAKPGPIKTLDGGTIGQHQGLMFHTIGQRKGLHIGGLKQFGTAPWYVADKDLAANTLLVVQGSDHPALFAPSLQATDCHWLDQAPQAGQSLVAKIRYQQAPQACSLNYLPNGDIQVNFADAQRAISPGQSIVFYNNEQCLGGAIIDKKLDVSDERF